MNTHFLNKRLAHLLGFTALVPFVLLSLACWVVHPDWLGIIVNGQISYSIAILSFLGGIHWGATLMSGNLSLDKTKRALLWGVIPSMIAWWATMVIIGIGFLTVILDFIGAYQVDKRLYRWYGMPDWFLRLRYKLTCVVVAALLLTLIAVNVRGGV